MANHQRAVVFSFETGEQLDGTASEELERACETDPDGVAAAYQDEQGVWKHVPAREQRRYMVELGRDVVPVRVERPN
jgi:hypothetical protein